MTERYVYSFACPFCHGSWTFEQHAVIAKNLFESFEGVAECPVCHGTFSWEKPGQLKFQKWYERKQYKHFKPKKCGACGKRIWGRKREYCNLACKQKAYRMRKKGSVTPN